jgi:translation initiation factor 5B
MGVKISANYLETALAGSPVFKYETDEELESYKEILNKDIKKIKKNVKLKPMGVGVAASTLGSLEALLVYLKQMKIDVSNICIGDVTKNDLLKILTPFH